MVGCRKQGIPQHANFTHRNLAHAWRHEIAYTMGINVSNNAFSFIMLGIMLVLKYHYSASLKCNNGISNMLSATRLELNGGKSHNWFSNSNLRKALWDQDTSM